MMKKEKLESSDKTHRIKQLNNKKKCGYYIILCIVKLKINDFRYRP